ncbi:hypothetical protein PVO39_004309 [Salmonella enterica]|nr:hypothetical protein [Salmonella enterica]
MSTIKHRHMTMHMMWCRLNDNYITRLLTRNCEYTATTNCCGVIYNF